MVVWWCGVAWCGVWCGGMRCIVVWCDVVRRGVVCCSEVRCGVWCDARYRFFAERGRATQAVPFKQLSFGGNARAGAVDGDWKSPLDVAVVLFLDF